MSFSSHPQKDRLKQNGVNTGQMKFHDCLTWADVDKKDQTTDDR